jgi:ribosome-associated protein
MEDVPIRGQMIRLGQLLKLAGVIDTGSGAKDLITGGQLTVNDVVETRRGRQLHYGDVVIVGEHQLRVVSRD